MNVSRSGYYKWLSRKGELNNYQKNRESLKEQIKKSIRSILRMDIGILRKLLEMRQGSYFRTCFVINYVKN